MEAPNNNNLPTQTNDVIINPGNPDSKLPAAPVISCGDWGGGCFLGISPENNTESGFSGCWGINTT